jgi:hypothetical protein
MASLLSQTKRLYFKIQIRRGLLTYRSIVVPDRSTNIYIIFKYKRLYMNSLLNLKIIPLSISPDES